MTIRTTVVGSYPKPPDEGQAFTLRKTLHALERGEADRDDLRRAHEDLARAVIEEHEAAGIDLITDGHVRWDDILTPVARHLEGFQIGGLLRWFDNNVYYRRPICTADVVWTKPCTVDEFIFAAGVSSKPVKAVLPGPVTFARLSVDEHYGDHERFVLALADALAQEAWALAEAGARHVQVDEPGLLDAPEDLALARNALERVVRDLDGVEVTLATYFGDAKRLGPELFDLPAQVFALDFVAGPANAELVRDLPSGAVLQAGLLDARNTKLEPVEEVVLAADSLLQHVGPDRLRIAPSAGLEYLPREKARAKLQRLGEVGERVGR